MRIATWNVNSVRARLPLLLAWLDKERPDVVLLQELKCTDEAFPRAEIEDQGYNVAVHGQKSLNGVAILSRRPLEEVRAGLPVDDGDQEARYLEAVTGDLRVASLYAPNGNPVGSERYSYKLTWMGRLRRHVESLLELEEALVLGGDYNVIPEPIDCHDPDAWADDALFQLDSRRSLRALLHLGLADAFRARNLEPGKYTFWDYQGGAWPANHGVRIDHLLLSPHAADRLVDCTIDRAPRAQPKASDHTPVIAALEGG